jgi:uncharacterized LabA/DUF88 family protein
MRLACLVDGFNLYHSVEDAIEGGSPKSIKWLNIRAMCEEHLSAFNNPAAHFSELFYFSSFANYRRDDAPIRHRAFIKALESTGFEAVYGVFKEKDVQCGADCRRSYKIHVEKQTDVNIALKLLELFHLGSCDGALIVTGDADLITAVKTAQRLFPNNPIGVAFPYERWNRELSATAGVRIKLTPEHYEKHVMAARVALGNGKFSCIPKEWQD